MAYTRGRRGYRVPRACALAGAACLLSLVMLRVFDFAVAVPAGEGLSLLYAPGREAASNACCAGMAVVAAALVAAQAAARDRLAAGRPLAYAAAACCAVGAVLPCLSEPLWWCGALLGAGAAALAFFALSHAWPMAGGGERRAAPTLGEALLLVAATGLAASLIDCALLAMGALAARASVCALGVGGAGLAALAAHASGGARGDVPGGQAPAAALAATSPVACRPGDGGARDGRMPEGLPFDGAWGTAAMLALLLACSYEAMVLMSSTGGPSVHALGSPGAAPDLALCCLISAVVGALAPKRLVVAYGGVLPFVGALAVAIDLSDDTAVYLFHVSGVTLFFGMALVLCAALLAWLAWTGRTPAAVAAGLLEVTAATATLARRLAGFPQAIDPTYEAVPNALIVLWMVCSIACWARLTRARPEAPTGGEGLSDGGALAASRAFGERYGLSAREAEIVAYVAEGYNAPYIAEKLGISDSTVRSHLRTVYQKTGAGSRMGLVEMLRQEREG